MLGNAAAPSSRPSVRPAAPPPDIAQALAWRNWPAGAEEARRRRVPILGLAEPRWTTSAQRLALVLGQDDGLRTLLAERVVPVLIDPYRRPDLAAHWRWAALALTGTSGPPLLMLLTHEGLPFLAYCSMWPEGRPPLPSLASLVRAAADSAARDPAAAVDEARVLPDRVRQDAAPPFPSAQTLWQALAVEADETLGGFRESPKHPHPQLLWLLLELGDGGETPEAAAFVRTTLRAMMRGGINDQIGEGFHRCARDERWIAPHFEKLLPLNAQLAALFARAARVFEDDDFRQTAKDLVSFCTTGLRRGVDAVGADSDYYTWTAREALEHLDPANVQAIGFYYHLTQHRSRHVLYRAVEPEAMDRFSYETPDALKQRIAAGRGQMRLARNLRPAPEAVGLAIPSWTAETVRWLFAAAEQGSDVSIQDLEAGLERLTADRLREGHGYLRPGDGDVPAAAWLEDQASILAAMLACHRATGAAHWRERARRLAGVVIDHYRHAAGWSDRPDGEGNATAQRSWAIADDVLPAPVATLTAALGELGRLVGDARYADAAHCAAADHLPDAQLCGPRAGSMWRAWSGINRALG